MCVYVYVYVRSRTSTPSTSQARVKHHPQKCTSKGIWRQGIVLKHRNSLQKSQCPAVICPSYYVAVTPPPWITEFHEPGLCCFSAGSLCGFVASADVRNTCCSFYNEKCPSLQISAILRKTLQNFAETCNAPGLHNFLPWMAPTLQALCRMITAVLTKYLSQTRKLRGVNDGIGRNPRVAPRVSALNEKTQ